MRVLGFAWKADTIGFFPENFAIFSGDNLAGLAAWLIRGRAFLRERHIDELKVTLVVFGSTWVALVLNSLVSCRMVLINVVFCLKEHF